MQMTVVILVLLSTLLTGLLVRTFLKLRTVTERFRPIIDVEAERKRVADELARAKSESERTVAAEQKRVAEELARAKSESEKALAAERKRTADEMARMREEADRAVKDAEARRQRANAQRAELEAGIARLTAEFQALEEEEILRSNGFYKPIYNFSSSEKYEQRLEQIREQQKAMLKD
ncbi:MAG TPA: DUF4041 domain-containing protein, partial [Archangium sp.]|nr:DUF4041 domain-containing protein [Archangium sp.]